MVYIFFSCPLAQLLMHCTCTLIVAVTGSGQLEWLLQGKEKSIMEDSETVIDDDNNGL